MNQAEAIAAAKSLGPEWKWVAMDENRHWYAYDEKPELPLFDNGEWFPPQMSHRLNDHDVEWRDTLVEVTQ
ncbi:hypothetical protein UFOVP602_10 [uncultured Caudovirales phage]|uniref:Uncharacterized protein n=1 Tax=uncultured Caudovirales phage TaxID=2100421 RepID=A0A6J5N2G2_9CAUD|nr:hypothetical protein UFOVP602_10 [uncultured Caudovirales phage]